jgi:prevent-host-death family protein
MSLIRDIYPLASFKRNTAEFLARLKQTGHPLVLTINGRAKLVVQDAKSYQRLLNPAERLETIQAVKEGLASMERSEGRPLDEVFEEVEKELRKKPVRDLPSHSPAE